jgi:hypothetical protein
MPDEPRPAIDPVADIPTIVDAEEYHLKVGNLSIDLDARGFGEVRVDGQLLPVRHLTLIVRPGIGVVCRIDVPVADAAR